MSKRSSRKHQASARERARRQAQSEHATSTATQGKPSGDGDEGTGTRPHGGQARARRIPRGELRDPSGEPVAGASGDGTPAKEVTRPRRSPSWIASKAMDVGAMMFGGGMFSAMIVARFGMGPTGQWVVGLTVMMAILLSQTVFSEGIGSIMDEAKAQVEEERRQQEEEISQGNFEGVPRIVQKMLPYPDNDDIRRAMDERERQKGLMRQWGEFLRGEKPAPWKRDDGDDAGIPGDADDHGVGDGER